ncbi:gametocyte-specific factor 1 homolog [Culicoides brevitarsis]|uniref:gametocyte-specific factor 1 homolog n=1 Tax=Culicoides brevitarsis TaxID=469753 RepID=UPI00307C8B4D
MLCLPKTTRVSSKMSQKSQDLSLKTRPGFENVIQCPYNPRHEILPYRMQTHLVKCERNHPHIKLEKCPFNSTHRFRSKQMQEHKKTCPDRLSFEHYVIKIGDEFPQHKLMDVKMPQRPIFIFEDEEESWDHFNVASYDPQEHVKSKPILRLNNGMTRIERERFRAAENKRISELLQAEGEFEDENEAKIEDFVKNEEQNLLISKENVTEKEETQVKGTKRCLSNDSYERRTSRRTRSQQFLSKISKNQS